jgi:hypothetical protein
MSKISYLVLASLILFLAIALRIYNLGGTSLWFDEAINANIVTKPFDEFLHETRSNNSAPIALPLVLWSLGDLVQNPFWIRFLPMVFGVLTVATVLLLPMVGISPSVALFSAVWMACLPAQVLYSQEVREYSLSMWVGALLIFAFLGAMRQSISSKYPFLLGVLLFLAPLCAYGSIFLGGTLLGIFYLFCVQKRCFSMYQLLWPGAAFIFGIGLSFLITAKYQMGIGKAWYLSGDYPPQHLFDFIFWLAKSTTKYFLFQYGALFPPVSGLWTLPRLLPSFAALLVLGLFVFWTIKNKKILSPESWLVFGFMLLLAGSILLAVLGLYPFGGLRQHLFASPLAILAVACSFSVLIQNSRRKNLLWGAFFLCSVVPGSLQGLPFVYRDAQNITTPVADLPHSIQDENVFVYYGAVPAVRFHHRNRQFYLSRSVSGQVPEMVAEVSSLDGEVVALLFSHMIFHEDHEIIAQLKQRGYSISLDKSYAGNQDGYPGSRLAVMKKPSPCE